MKAMLPELQPKKAEVTAIQSDAPNFQALAHSRLGVEWARAFGSVIGSMIAWLSRSPTKCREPEVREALISDDIESREAKNPVVLSDVKKTVERLD